MIPFAPAARAAAAVMAVVCSLAALPAQIPQDHALLLLATAQVSDDAFRLVDLRAGGATPLRRQSVYVQMSAAAIDPTNPRQLFFEASSSAFSGTWRSQVGVLATLGTSNWGQWTRSPADRVEVGPTRVFTMRAGVIEATPKSGGAPSWLATVPGASDLAATDTHLYVSVYHPAVAQPLVEVDQTTGAMRNFGAVPGAASIAALPGSNTVVVGTDAGDLLWVDVASGVVRATRATGLGQVSLLGLTRQGHAVYGDGSSLWSEATPNAPLFVSSTQQILDVSIARAAVATLTPYGSTCVPSSESSWLGDSVPSLGNAGFRLVVNNVRSNPVVFTLGGSRTTAAALGGVPLPFSLQGVGAAGCELLADPLVVVPGSAGTSFSEVIVPVPNQPWLRGRRLYAQYLIGNGGANALGLYASEGVALALE